MPGVLRGVLSPVSVSRGPREGRLTGTERVTCEDDGKDRMEIAETKLPCTVSSPHVARVFVGRVLHAWHLDRLCEVSKLLATELVANVVTHVGGPMTLRAVRDGLRVRVEIDDPSPVRPVVRRPAFSEEHGRGMLLVDQLAEAWGVDWRPDGKTVWFELDATRVGRFFAAQGASS